MKRPARRASNRLVVMLLLAILACGGEAASVTRASPGSEPLQYQQDVIAQRSSDWGVSWAVMVTGALAVVGTTFATYARRQDRIRAATANIPSAAATSNDGPRYDAAGAPCGKATQPLDALAPVG
jgi:hypothetical protein